MTKKKSTIWKGLLDLAIKLIPALIVAFYDGIQHKMKRLENKNLKMKLENEGKLKKEKRKNENAKLSDNAFISKFINKFKNYKR